jgi:hypothetical protein
MELSHKLSHVTVALRLATHSILIGSFYCLVRKTILHVALDVAFKMTTWMFSYLAGTFN